MIHTNSKCYLSLLKIPLNVILLYPLFLGNEYFANFQGKLYLLFLLTNVLWFQMGVFYWLIYHHELLPHYLLVMLQKRHSFVCFVVKSNIILYESLFLLWSAAICLACGSGLAWSAMPSRQNRSLFLIIGKFSFPFEHSSRQQVFPPTPDPLLPKLAKDKNLSLVSHFVGLLWVTYFVKG